jgi:hypothetical protein
MNKLNITPFITLLLVMMLSIVVTTAQNQDSVWMRKIYNEVLSAGKAYDNLEELTRTIGHRLSGSPQAAKAVEWAAQKMKDAGADSVWLQEVWVPRWVRGEKEKGVIIQSNGARQEVPVCALGMSVATAKEGLTAEIIEVKSFDELKSLGTEKIKSKIVFYNTPFDQCHVNTFRAYGESGKYRWAGPSEASRYGAVATILRSLSSSDNDYPHTGSMRYNDSLPPIPCAAISTNGANLLSRIVKADPKTKFHLKQNCQLLDSVLSYNVVGELKGSEFPAEIIVAGGHLDSWDMGTGAHDDGAGIVQTIEVIRAMKALNIKPKRSIRIVAFMNEENGLKGGKQYAQLAKEKNENHIAAIESDAGGFVPYGISMDGAEKKREQFLQWAPLFKPYNIWHFDYRHGGADIGPLEDQGVPVMGLVVESQRYFDVHHANSDTFDKVNKRELHLGAATIASLVYLLSMYGL